jgi:hypothetical protein
MQIKNPYLNSRVATVTWPSVQLHNLRLTFEAKGHVIHFALNERNLRGFDEGSVGHERFLETWSHTLEE